VVNHALAAHPTKACRASSSRANFTSQKSKVVYLLVYEPDRLISNSEQILGRSATGLTLAETLYEAREAPPRGLTKIFANRFFKIYEVAP
jgi:hypothetical protein